MSNSLPGNLQALDLHDRLRPPGTGLDPVPLFDVVLIVLMFLMLGSRFVFAPGVGINLPEIANEPLGGLPTVDVVTVKGADFVLFKGAKLTLDWFRADRELPNRPALAIDSYLLVRADRDVDLQTLVVISQWAKQKGYAGVQLAARERGSPENRGDQPPTGTVFP